jgi:hypothetical protein
MSPIPSIRSGFNNLDTRSHTASYAENSQFGTPGPQISQNLFRKSTRKLSTLTNEGVVDNDITAKFNSGTGFESLSQLSLEETRLKNLERVFKQSVIEIINDPLMQVFRE